jgi:hypothetical protein
MTEPEVRARPARPEEIPNAARLLAAKDPGASISYARGTPDPGDLRQQCSGCGRRVRLTAAGLLYKHGSCEGSGVGPVAAHVVDSIVVRGICWRAVWEDGKFTCAYVGDGWWRPVGSPELKAWLANRNVVGF